MLLWARPNKIRAAIIKTANANIQDNVNKFGKLSQVKAMNDELNYMDFEKQEVNRQAQLTKINEFTNRVSPVIFPCMATSIAPVARKTDTIAYSRK